MAHISKDSLMAELTSQEVFLADTKTKIKQYLYRELESKFDPSIEFIQVISKLGPINWHIAENKSRIQTVFSNLAIAISEYGILNGDFRYYLLLKFVDILYEEFKSELFLEYVKSSYNVDPLTVTGQMDDSPLLAPPQNTNLPGLSNTSQSICPNPRTIVPDSIYNDDL